MKKTTCKTTQVVEWLNSIDKPYIKKQLEKTLNYFGADVLGIRTINQTMYFNIVYKGIDFIIIRPKGKGKFKDIYHYKNTNTFEITKFKTK